MAVSEATNPWPDPLHAPDEGDLTRCVHCGLCVNACPTYLVTGLETESPRGRIALARGVADGLIDLTATVERHWDQCLQCRACEVACPSGVAYGRIIGALRAQVASAPRSSRTSRRFRRLLIRNVIARRRVLGFATIPLRLYGNSRLGRLLSRTGITRWPRSLGRLERQLVRNQGAAVRPGAELARPAARPAGEVILFTGCVTGEMFGEVHRATARVLARRGVAVDAARGQVCCGALSAHDGDVEHARQLARRNIEGLGGDGRRIIVNAAGCGAALREYGELLAGDPAWSARAADFAARVLDLTEYLETLDTHVRGSFPARVAYQDACHLAHVQGITAEPRKLLRDIEGCELVESAGDSTCCGAAGLYGVVEPEMSDRLRARKVEQFIATAPDVIVTANPGCHMQYEAARKDGRLPARVMHIAEFLDQADRNEAPLND